jgi:CheY-like chemotaxis protein
MIKILYVDDDRVALKMVKSILESAGYAVTTTTDPRDGLERMKTESFDLVISDANMPGGVSGFDMVRTIRSQMHFDKVAVALLTGRREKKDIQLGLECGANDYIIKPIDPDILLSKVESLIKKKAPQHPAARFAERSVRQQAKWDLDIQITYVSERGLTLWAPLYAPIDAKIKVRSDFFTAVGIEPPILRVAGYTRDPSQEGMFYINTVFVGVHESELQKIRAWIHSASKSKAS